MATLFPVFFVSLTDTPGAKHRYQVGYAAPVSFEQYESVFGDRAGDPRNDQRIGQERAKAKSASCISFQIVEYASNDGCQSPFFSYGLAFTPYFKFRPQHIPDLDDAKGHARVSNCWVWGSKLGPNTAGALFFTKNDSAPNSMSVA
jgi:hypothetical protein